MPKITQLPNATLPLSGIEIINLVQSGVTKQAIVNNLPIGTPTQTALNNKADLVAGLVPAIQLPSYVDEILEYANLAAFPITGLSNKIYLALDTVLLYRWSGSIYVTTGSGLALGETTSTAYRGDRGKIAYDHTLITAGNPHGTTLAQITSAGATTADTINGKTESLTDNSTKLATTAFVKGQNYIQSTSSFTLYSIPYSNNLGILTQDNAGLYYNGSSMGAGVSNPGVFSGVQLNGNRARILGAAAGIYLQVGTAGTATPDTTRTIKFYNQDLLYATMGSTTTSAHYTSLNTTLYPTANNTWDLGSSTNRWNNTYLTNINVAGTVTGIDKTDVGLSNVDNTSDVNKPISTATQTALDLKVNIIASVNAQVGTTYTLQASDNGKVVTLNNASPITLTVPSGLGSGFNCLIVQIGAGQVTIAASGVTINNRQAFTKIAGQYGAATLAAYTTNVFISSGDMSA